MKTMARHLTLLSIITLLSFGCTQRDSGPDTAMNPLTTPPVLNTLPGTEMLGLAGQFDASGVVVAGVGLRGDGTSGTISVIVPGEVVQAWLYWEGQMADNNTDSNIMLNGSAITGTVIGGPTEFFGGAWSSTNRYDVTSLVGDNTTTNLDIAGLDFTRGCPDCRNNGAGVVVVYDDGTQGCVQVYDGNDLAFFQFDPPLDTTTPITFNCFSPSDDARKGTLSTLASSIQENRPNAIKVTPDVGPVQYIVDPWMNTAGTDYDAVTVEVDIPANATSLTVQALSEKVSGSSLDGLPASFAWQGAALAVPAEEITPPPPVGDQGCTPGYWKNHDFAWEDTGFDPEKDYFNVVFGCNILDPDLPLGKAISHGGGGVYRLGRHGTAALLNATHPSVAYGLTLDEVMEAVCLRGDADLLEYHNEMGCPLGNKKHNESLK